jgi:hypothetical protein
MGQDGEQYMQQNRGGQYGQYQQQHPMDMQQPD